MHEWIVRVWPWSIPVCGQSRILIVFSSTDVAVGLPLHACLEVVLPFVPAPVQRILERRCEVKLLGVGYLVGIISQGQAVCKPVSFGYGVHRRLVRPEGVEPPGVREVVRVVDGRIQRQIGRPGAVEEPGQGRIGPEGVVPHLGELPGESVGIVLGVHASEVAGRPGLETERIGESVGIRQRYAPADVGLIRRDKLFRGPGPFRPDVQDSAPFLKVQSLGKGGLPGARIDSEGHVQRCTALARMDADHSAVQVAVFGGRHTGDDFHRLDVVHGDTAGVHSRHGAEAGVVAEPDAVHLQCGSEGGVGRSGPA